MIELRDIAEGKKFKFPRPTMLTGVYFRSGRATIPDYKGFFCVHEVGIPGDLFYASEGTNVIPVEEEQ